MTDQLPHPASFLIAFVVVTAGTLLWVHLSDQSYVPRTWAYSVRVALRVFLLTLVMFLISGVIGIRLLGLVVVLVLIGLSVFSFGDPAGIAMLGGLWAVQQFILGFPDLEKVKLQVPEAKPEASELDSLVGKSGEAKTPLAPSGSVVIDGSLYNAVTDDRGYVDRGSAITVSSVARECLIVRLK